MLKTLSDVGTRLHTYNTAPISRQISEHDIMLARGVPGAEQHYLSVGRSAIEVIAQAMISTRKTAFRKVLDLPCGGGRVTRHLVKLFPDSEIFISELDRNLEDFTATTFGAKPILSSPDFATTHGQTFDLIFAGSLVTHLDALKFQAAVKWFIGALADDGVLVLTTAGRRADHCQRTLIKTIEPSLWEVVSSDLRTKGFGYIETERNAAGSYGLTLAAASWITRLIEQDPSVRIASVQECAWDNHQDVFVIQKRAIA
jgi:SAM-dependent methyltransferase